MSIFLHLSIIISCAAAALGMLTLLNLEKLEQLYRPYNPARRWLLWAYIIGALNFGAAATMGALLLVVRLIMRALS